MGRVILQLGISVDGFVVYPPAEEHEEMVKWKLRSVSESADFPDGSAARVYRPAVRPAR